MSYFSASGTGYIQPGDTGLSLRSHFEEENIFDYHDAYIVEKDTNQQNYSDGGYYQSNGTVTFTKWGNKEGYDVFFTAAPFNQNFIFPRHEGVRVNTWH